jgi:hypothetical protein
MPDATLVGESRGTPAKRAEPDLRSAWEDQAFDAAALAERLRREADRFLKDRPPDEPRAFR